MESWVGKRRAKEIRLRMSTNSKGKAEFLRSLNRNTTFLEKRVASRRRHEEFVRRLIKYLRTIGLGCYTLSEFV